MILASHTFNVPGSRQEARAGGSPHFSAAYWSITGMRASLIGQIQVSQALRQEGHFNLLSRS